MSIRKIFYHILICVCYLFVISCTDNNTTDWTEDVTLEVDSQIFPCNIFGEPNYVDGIRIRPTKTSTWEIIPKNSINGFSFEEGYAYILLVKVTHLADPLQDDSNIKYNLIRVISIEKKS